MSWSVTEIATLACKAARGAGAPPGQAERFGQAAAIHLSTGRAPEEIEAALRALPFGPVVSYPLALDAALADLRTGGPGVVSDLSCDPLLTSYVDAFPLRSFLKVTDNGVMRLTADCEIPSAHSPARRIVGCDALVARMMALAKRTLVPESEASRRAGAGAGLTDND